MNKKLIASIFYIAIAVSMLLHLINLGLPQWGSAITKILPFGIGIWFVIWRRVEYWGVMVVGFGFSMCGDVAGHYGHLLPQIGFFSMAQICYILLFSKKGWDLSYAKWSVPLLGGLVYFAYLSLNSGKINELPLQIGILVYVALLALSGVSCYCGRLGIRQYSAIGITFFILSDTMIGYNTFLGKIPYAGLLIMSTYYIAQFLLLRSFLRDK